MVRILAIQDDALSTAALSFGDGVRAATRDATVTTDAKIDQRLSRFSRVQFKICIVLLSNTSYTKLITPSL